MARVSRTAGFEMPFFNSALASCNFIILRGGPNGFFILYLFVRWRSGPAKDVDWMHNATLRGRTGYNRPIGIFPICRITVSRRQDGSLASGLRLATPAGCAAVPRSPLLNGSRTSSLMQHQEAKPFRCRGAPAGPGTGAPHKIQFFARNETSFVYVGRRFQERIPRLRSSPIRAGTPLMINLELATINGDGSFLGRQTTTTSLPA